MVEDAEAIARKLSAPQRHLLIELPRPTWEQYQPAKKLVRQNLAYFHVGKFGQSLCATDLGLAVRAHLLKEKDHG